MSACGRGRHSRGHGRHSRRRHVAAVSFVCGLLTTLATACDSSVNPSPDPLPSGPSTVASASKLPDGVVASIPVSDGAGATSLAIVDDSLWVVDYGSQKVARIDPASNRVVQMVDIGRNSCGQPLGAFGHLWTQPCPDITSTVVVDGRSGSVRGTISDAGGSAATAGAGSVWISKYGGKALKRIDPKTLKVQKVILVESGNVAFDGHFIWSAALEGGFGNANGRLAKVDPATNRVVASYRLPPMSQPFTAYGFGALWFKPIETPLLYRFDLLTGRTTSPPLDGWRPLTDFRYHSIAVGAGSLWLRLADEVVVRIDPSTNRIAGRYEADAEGRGGFPLVAFDSLWVANYTSSSVWRQQIRPNG